MENKAIFKKSISDSASTSIVLSLIITIILDFFTAVSNIGIVIGSLISFFIFFAIGSIVLFICKKKEDARAKEESEKSKNILTATAPAKRAC